MSDFSKIILSFGKYKGIPCDSEKDAEYTFKCEQTEERYRDKAGNFSLSMYHNGRQEDLEFNGWAVSCVGYGTFQNEYVWDYSKILAGVSINIECRDPNGESLTLKNRIRDTNLFKVEGGALYMNTVAIVCLFKDKVEYDSVKDVLFNPEFLQENELKDVLAQLMQINNVIKRNEGNEKISNEFLTIAKTRYKKMLNEIKNHVELEKVLEVLFD